MGSANKDRNPLVLWENFLAEDQNAFDRLFNMFHRDLIAFSFFLSTDKHDAKDLAQDTWLKLMTTKPEITTNFKSYLFRTGKNLWYDRFSKGRDIYNRSNRMDTEDIAATLSKTYVNPKVDNDSQVQHIDHIIESCLDQRELRMWNLHCNGFSPGEIAFELSEEKAISPKTVWNLLSMIRYKLRTSFNKNDKSNP